MNRDESIALFQENQKQPGAWNEWAEKLLLEKDALVEAGEWGETQIGKENSTVSNNLKTQEWIDRARVHFDFIHFVYNYKSSEKEEVRANENEHFVAGSEYLDVKALRADFTELIFPGDANFNDSVFEVEAWFDGAFFFGVANFPSVRFQNFAWFSDSVFEKPSHFFRAKFLDASVFIGTDFNSTASFLETDFLRYSTFEEAKFSSTSDFTGVHSERTFDLSGAEFTKELPNFSQAHFNEAPQLNGLIYPKIKFFKIEDLGTEGKFRALKRLALQGHDHEKELEFFAGEIRARRHNSDRFIDFPSGTLRYVSGLIYDIFSDFGRSIWRPLFLFAGVFYAFTQLYIHQGTTLTDGKCANSDKMTASYAAYTIAAKNSLLFLGTDRTDKIKRAYTCLYGAAPIYEKPEATAGNNRIKTGYENVTRTSRHMAPNVPWAVSALGTAHSILSLSLIFLLLLAIRNQFKIK